MKEFLLSDESLNSHGTVVMTDGIRLDRFLANPVMFYNHDESKGVVGRWEKSERRMANCLEPLCSMSSTKSTNGLLLFPLETRESGRL